MEKQFETGNALLEQGGVGQIESLDAQEGEELIGLRAEYEKHYDFGGGRRQAVVYPESVHYREKGKWREIDGNLERAVAENGRAVWRNRAGALGVELAERADDGALVTVRNGENVLSWRFVEPANGAACAVKNGEALKREKLLALAKTSVQFSARSASTLSDNELGTLQTAQEKRLDRIEKGAEARFDGLLPGVTVAYSLRGDRLKEDIILENKEAMAYAALALTGNFIYQLMEDGSIAVNDATTGAAAFAFRAPVAYDADGVPLTVGAKLENQDGQTVLRYVIPEAELERAAFPVTIDPETTLKPAEGELACMSVKSNGTSTGLDPAPAQVEVGRGSAGYDNIVLLRFDKLPGLKASDTAVRARLRMTAADDSGSTQYASACALKGHWTAGTNYTTAVNLLEDDELDCQAGGAVGKRLDFEITNLFRDWYTKDDVHQSRNFGVALRKPKGMPVDGNYQKLYGRGAATSDYRPFLIINYMSHAGVEGWWKYEQASAGRAGIAYVDLFNGTSAAQHQDTAMSGANTSVSVTHHYNSCPPTFEGEGGGADESDEDPSNAMPDFHCGRNWKLNVQQFVYKRTLARTNGDKITYLIWMDGDGTEHYFKTTKAVSPYRDREGLGLTIEENDANAVKPYRYTIRTKQGVSMSFQQRALPGSSYVRDRYWLTHIFKTGMPATTGSRMTEATIYYYGDAGETGLSKAQAEGRVTRIVDAAGRETQFEYQNDRLWRIRVPGQKRDDGTTVTKVTTYTYDVHGRLTGIHYSDLPGTAPHTAYTYDGTSGLLTGLNNYDATQVKLSYEAASRYNMNLFPGVDVHSMRRAVSLEAQGSAGGTTGYGKKLLFEYQTMQTVAAVVDGTGANDTAGKKLIYQFNDRGNVVAVRDELGYAHFARYEDGESNALTDSSKVQRVVINRLRKSDLSEVGTASTNAWVTGGTGTLTRDTTERCLNAASVKMYRTASATGESVCKQTGVKLTKGKPHVLSAYVKATGANVNAFMRVTVDGTVHVSEAIDAATPDAMGNGLPADGWERLQLTFTPPGTGTATAQVELLSKGTGGINTVYFACPQLEEGETVSSVNLLTNGDFGACSDGSKPDDWTQGSNIQDSDGEGPYVRTPGVNAPALPGQDQIKGNAVRIVGRPNRDARNFSQDITLKGSKGDLFFAGGWAHGKSAPKADTDERGFRLLVRFQKNGTSTWEDGAQVAFNSAWVGWQYAGGPVKAPFDYDKVRMAVVYIKNVNEAYFTNVFLFREAYGKSFVYDANKNLEAAGTLAGTQTAMTYDGQDNMISYRAAGRTSDTARWTMTYGDTTSEKEMHLMRTMESPEGVRHVYTYDEYGNRTADSIKPSTSDRRIKTKVGYDAAGNYVTRMIDQRGYVTKRESDANTGVVKKVTPAAAREITATTETAIAGAQSVTYQYDDADRLLKVTAATDAGAYRNEYTYENDRLKTVRHNTSASTSEDVMYEIEYDALGAQKRVKVGNGVLSENVYAADRSHKLMETQFGSGGACGRVKYAYDAFDRLKGVAYDGADPNTGPRYKYAYGANGEVARVTDNQLGRVHETTQDLAGRPMRTKLARTDGTRLHETYLKYEKTGNLSRFDERIGDKDWQNAYEYDKDDRTTKIAYKIRARANGTATELKNMSVAYTRGSFNRVSARNVTNGSGTCNASYDFVLDGNPAETQAETGMIEKITYTYGGAKDNFQYAYDERGNIAAVKRYAGTTANDNASVTYEYDKLGQLIRVNDKTDPSGGAGGTTWKYEYDFGGNIKSKKRYAYTTATTPTGEYTTTYAYNDGNWKDKLTAYDGKAVTYNAIGNPLSYDGWNYEWQAGRQLKKMTRAASGSGSYGTVTVNTTTMTASHTQGTADAGHTFAIASDGSLNVTIPSGGNPYTLTGGTLMAGDAVAGASAVEFDYDANGLRILKRADGVETHYTLHGKLITHLKKGTDELHFFYDAESRPALVDFNGTVYTYLHNLQGDIVAILDAAGTKVVEYGYDAWGKPTKTTGTLKATLGALNPFRYRGYVYDEETGMYYLRSRYYNPEWGRFVNADTLLGKTGELLNHNIFAYCNNCPVTAEDQDGYAATLLGGGALVFLIYMLGQAAGVIKPPAPEDMNNVSRYVEKTIDALSGPTVPISAIENAIPDIAGQYGNHKCVEAADAVSEFLKKQREHGEIITIHYTSGPGFIISDTYGGTEISLNGMHHGVNYKGTVYCNVHPYGLPEDAWLNDFHGYPEWSRQIYRTPF